ncbi:MAG: SMC-Scp complex subunit ScpB [Lachnospiraceae bacterium]|nr:SMC-Scp complex subunit ScpB [Lachnospiraceae bacterium]
MEREKIEATIEAVLFAMGDAVEIEKLSVAIGHDKETTRKIIHQMMDWYNKKEGGMEIIELQDSFQLTTRREYYEALIKVAKQPKKYVLTDVQLEVLSIVAYKQPVTRQEVEKIRGVNSDHALNRLVEYGLVGEAGRLDAPGRPILFGTTEEFLRNFGVRSTEELPSIGPDLVEEMKSQAEQEVQLKLDL